MKIEIFLHHDYEFEAFATFSKELAKGHKEYSEKKGNKASRVSGAVGSVSAGNPVPDNN